MLAVFLLVAGATGFLLSWVLFRFGVF